MAKPLSYFERMNVINKNRGTIADSLARTLEQDHRVPADLARKTAQSAIASIGESAFDAHGVLPYQRLDEAKAKALGLDEVKRAIVAVSNGDRPITDATPPHELSVKDALLADQQRFDRLTPAQQLAERRARGEIV